MLGLPAAGAAAPGGAGMLGAADMAVLAGIPRPDAEAQQRYDALGLPDPVAFAALTALGAIPDPMGMLNRMMSAAQERIGREAVAPGAPAGRGFMEAFRELQRQQELEQPPGGRPDGSAGGCLGAAQLARAPQADAEADAEEVERLEARVREAAEQAKMASDRAREAMQLAAANRDASTWADPDAWRASARDGVAALDVARAFAADGGGDEPEAPPGPRHLGTTLTSLLTGRLASESGVARPLSLHQQAQLGAFERVCIQGLPAGASEADVRLECARHGAVTSVVLEPEGDAAYVAFATADMAANAVRRLASRPGALGGGAEPPRVRLLGEAADSARLMSMLPVPAPLVEPTDPADLPEYLRVREVRRKKRSRSRRQRREKRKRSRSRPRWLDRSRSNSHTATGQYIRATGCSSTVRWWEKKRESGSSSSASSSRSRARRGREDALSRRPRQVAVRGHWAQYVLKGETYYYNVEANTTSWEKPREFDSRRFAEAPRGDRPTSTFL